MLKTLTSSEQPISEILLDLGGGGIPSNTLVWEDFILEILYSDPFYPLSIPSFKGPSFLYLRTLAFCSGPDASWRFMQMISSPLLTSLFSLDLFDFFFFLVVEFMEHSLYFYFKKSRGAV